MGVDRPDIMIRRFHAGWPGGILILCLLLTGAVAGEQAGSSPEPAGATAEAETLVLRGSVRGADGRPLAGATIRYLDVSAEQSENSTPFRSRVTRTASDGTFSAENVAGPLVDVRVHAEGHAFRVFRDHETASTLEVSLERGSPVVGRVLDASGRGLEGVRVRLDGDRRFDLAGPELETRTDDAGAYRFPHAPPGPVWVRASAPGRARRSAEGVVTGKSPAAVEDIWMPAGGRISGRVTNSGGRPIADAQVIGVAVSGVLGGHRGRFPVVKTRSLDDGSFVLEGITAGAGYEVRGFADEHPAAVVGPFMIERGSDLADIALTLGRGATLRFRLVDPDDKPVREVTVHLLAESRGPQRSLTGSQVFDAAADEIDALDDGWMAISGLRPGRFTVRVEPGRWAGLRREGVRLIEGETATLETIRLEPGTSVAGRIVTDEGKPVVGAEVRSRWRDFSSEYSRVAVSDDDGRFLIRGNPDHPTSLEVVAEGFATRTVRDVAPGRDDVVVTLRRHATARGAVEWPDGVPPTAYEVRAVPQRRGAVRSIRIDPAQTGFEIGALDPGTYVFEVMASGLAPGRTGKQRVRAGMELDVGVVPLGRGISITGRVMRDDGVAPAPGARIRLDRGAGPESWTADAPDAAAVADAAGRFAFSGLEERRYTITVDHPEFAPFQQSIEPSAEAPANEFEFRLGAGGVVGGVVTDADGMPVVAASVYIVREARGFDRRLARTLADGTFRFERLAPGTYLVIRTDPGGGGAFGNQMRTVKVVAGEVAELILAE